MDSSSTFLERTCNSLDWARVLDRLLTHTGSIPGQERVRALTFTEDLEVARARLTETTELRGLLDKGRAPPLGGLRDVRKQLEAAVRGEILVGRDFIEISETLATCNDVRRFFHDEIERCPKVAARAATLPDLQDLGSRLGRSFDGHGELSATMYPQLAALRQRMQSLHTRIRERLTALIASAAMEDLLQDRYYTVRGDRYVLPIKASARNSTSGLIHDASGSGQTVFVEPQEIIPLGNDLKLAEAELLHEERRILTSLSQAVAARAPQIESSLTIAAELEFITARGRLSVDLDGVEPSLNPNGRVVLHEARHPVLLLRGVQVVPNDITLGTRHDAIVISGPNTGGKTVALKTLGLCALMVRVGLHLPVGAGSEMALFRRVLTDIGDTQSIEGDLSTFSGHMTTIRDMLAEVDVSLVGPGGKATPDALVLLDEIAVGTDPVQGAALAQSVLLTLVDKGCKVVVTTHYGELKTLASFDARFANARVEYDGLKPTYKLVFGPPGRSFALDIARRLGMPAAVLKRAESFLTEGTRAIEELLSDLEAQLTTARVEREKAQREREAATLLRERYEKKAEQLDKELDRLRRDKWKSLEAELARARAEIREVVATLQKAPSADEVEGAKKKIEVITHKMRDRLPAASAELEAPGSPMDWASARAGEEVWLTRMKRRATLAEDPRGEGAVEVYVGGMKTRVPREEVRSARGAPHPPAPGPRPPRADTPPRAPEPPPRDNEQSQAIFGAFQTSRNTLDLRGSRVDEGLDAVERFLDQASLSGEPHVFIIHGHGTGALRDAIRTWLKDSPYVQEFAPADRSQGGNGVTVVALE